MTSENVAEKLPHFLRTHDLYEEVKKRVPPDPENGLNIVFAGLELYNNFLIVYLVDDFASDMDKHYPLVAIDGKLVFADPIVLSSFQAEELSYLSDEQVMQHMLQLQSKLSLK